MTVTRMKLTVDGWLKNQATVSAIIDNHYRDGIFNVQDIVMAVANSGALIVSEEAAVTTFRFHKHRITKKQIKRCVYNHMQQTFGLRKKEKSDWYYWV